MRALTVLLGILLMAPALPAAGSSSAEAFDRTSASCGSTGFTTDHCASRVAGAVSLSCDASGACAYALAGAASAASSIPGVLRLDVHAQAGNATRAAHLCAADAVMENVGCAFDAAVATALVAGACEDLVVYASAWQNGAAFRAVAWQSFRACVDESGSPTLAPLGGSDPTRATLDLP